MFNFFTIEKDQNEQGIEQENLSLSEHTEQIKNEQKYNAASTSVHGESGVCCGGCGG